MNIVNEKFKSDAQCPEMTKVVAMVRQNRVVPTYLNTTSIEQRLL